MATININHETPMKPAEIAARLGRKVSTVRKWIRAGQLESVRIGGRRYSTWEAVGRMSGSADIQRQETGAAGNSSQSRELTETRRELARHGLTV